MLLARAGLAQLANNWHHCFRAVLLIWVLTPPSCWRAALAIMDPTIEERRMAWKYPDCVHLEGQADRLVDWPGVRRKLHSQPYPAKVLVAFEAMENMRRETSVIDEEARSCLMGIPTVFYYICYHSLDEIEASLQETREVDPVLLEKATLQYSVLHNYASVLHPGLIDASNWTISDKDINQLRRRLLRLSWNARKRHSNTALQPITDIRVYVYEEEEVPELEPLLRGYSYCSRGQWGAEVQIHDFFLTADCRTDDPHEADFFVVPGYSICALEGNLRSMNEIDEIYKSIVKALPHFNVTGGRDHIFMFVSGMAHNIFESWQDHIPRSIALTPETELFNDFAWISTPPFDTWRDIVIPGSLDLVEVVGLMGKAKPLEHRKHLAAFFGRVDLVRGPHPWVGGADVRRDILRLSELPNARGLGGDLLFGDNATHDVMHAAYGDARFCFVPRGKSGWSLRFFEALFAGCIPVMISDRWELPFEEFLDVSKFVIKWPSKHVGPQLLDYLRSLPDSVVQGYMEEGRQARCWYFYPPLRTDIRQNTRLSAGVCPEDEGKDVYRGIMRILRRRRRISRTSPNTFYFRDARGELVQVDADLQALRPMQVGHSA